MNLSIGHRLNLNSTKNFSLKDYYPFGMLMPGRNFETEENYVFGYQGSLQDNEINGSDNTYTTEFRELDVRTSRWYTIDPKISTMPWESPYMSMGANPILNNDKLGDKWDGDYVDQSGKYLGWDGKRDENIYVVLDKDQIAAIAANDAAGKTTPAIPQNTFFTLPPFEHRQEMQKIMNGQSTPAYYESGGKGYGKDNGNWGLHLRAQDGPIAGPYDTHAEINLYSIHSDDDSKKFSLSAGDKVFYTWHSHPDGGWNKNPQTQQWMNEDEFKKYLLQKTGTTIGRDESEYFIQPASDVDIDNAASRGVHNNFVLSKKDNKVYMYNGQTNKKKGYSGKLNLDNFYNLKSKSH